MASIPHPLSTLGRILVCGVTPHTNWRQQGEVGVRTMSGAGMHSSPPSGSGLSPPSVYSCSPPGIASSPAVVVAQPHTSHAAG
jgi:hypothetical protein